MAVLCGFGMAGAFLVVLECYAQYQLKKTGNYFWKLYHPKPTALARAGLAADTLSVLDPLLGYQWDIAKAPPNLIENHLPFIVADRFKVFLSKSVRSQWKEHSQMADIRLTTEVLATLERPFIVALGGSTTDPFGSCAEGSWPEELARLFEQQDKPGTVFAGGVSGYTTAQEVLKLLRDVLEIEPDVVISYGGYNDFYSFDPDFHWIREQQAAFYKSVSGMPDEPFGILPNLRYYGKRFLKLNKADPDVPLYLGRKSTLTPEQRLVRNWDLMYAVCNINGIRFYGVLQPVFGLIKPADRNRTVERWNLINNPVRKKVFDSLEPNYEKVRSAVETRKYLADFTMIFAEEEDETIFTFERDPVHINLKGNRIVAENMYRLLTNDAPRPP